MSVGLGLAFPAFSSTALIRVSDRDAGVASALVNTTQQIGGSLGTALLNTLAATATASYIAAHGAAAVPGRQSSTGSPWPSPSAPASLPLGAIVECGAHLRRAGRGLGGGGRGRRRGG